MNPRVLLGLALCGAISACGQDLATDSGAAPGATVPSAPLTPPAPEEPASPPPVSGSLAYTNPVYPGEFADPFVFRSGGSYYAMATNVGPTNVPVLRSGDLVHWTPLPDALPRLPAWAVAGQSLTWAPAVVERGGRFVMYYTARDRSLGLQCLGRAKSEAAEGPYADDSTRPFLCQADLGGSIDPSPFVDADGALYLVWKNDGNCCGKTVGLWSQRLTADGSGLVGQAVRLLVRDQDWEGPLIEGPFLWREGGTYYLFYSANWYQSDRYAIGYGTCAGPLGPCAKPRTGPLVASAGAVAGPGGQTLFADARGTVWMAYHAWTAPRIGYDAGGVRSLRIDRLRFVDGVPALDGPSTTAQRLE